LLYTIEAKQRPEDSANSILTNVPDSISGRKIKLCRSFKDDWYLRNKIEFIIKKLSLKRDEGVLLKKKLRSCAWQFNTALWINKHVFDFIEYCHIFSSCSKTNLFLRPSAFSKSTARMRNQPARNLRKSEKSISKSLRSDQSSKCIASFSS